MSEYQYVIDTLKRLAYADEGDQITHCDLNECDTAAAIIVDLESDIETLQEQKELAYKEVEAQVAKVGMVREALTSIYALEPDDIHYASLSDVALRGLVRTMGRLASEALQQSGDAAGGGE